MFYIKCTFYKRDYSEETIDNQKGTDFVLDSLVNVKRDVGF